ncbi:hypothetical protein Si087_00543 [Streptococcus infantarius subsp. infantarius]|nr:hypothetical protein [Streptococcus infantarius subsp. infantarius]MCO4549766.1 hypothetical protein [Streptococcus infantarius subsp. infantarius]MCO4552189.1 hypothetical protein [Streptococcus infantarius subsp. infantarius]MCO4565092.1 hypothetical protein [Streptococcus infantarius subsp. infantarius]MCO4574540.1 hypothetical protein [Streptococcus infantarius subsp. infantarius]
MSFSSKLLLTSEDLIFFELSVDVAGTVVFSLVELVFAELSVDVAGTVVFSLVELVFAELSVVFDSVTAVLKADTVSACASTSA